MRILDLARTYRSLRRLKDIVVVLSRHGFDEVLDRTQLGSRVPGLSRLLVSRRGVAEMRIPPPDRLVRVLEELGPTFVKFGQMLATRPDLISEPYVEALTALHDQVAPFDSAQARRVVEQELGRPIAEVFASFADQPAASGSLAQVHFAELADGRRVAVKIKRPEAEKLALADLELLLVLAELAEKHLPELASFHPRMIVEEFGRNLRRELNFATEANAMARFARFFSAEAPVRVPAVFWKFSSPSLLVMERLEGAPLSDLAALRASGHDLPKLAATLSEAFMRQFFELGYFHADPHAGNVLALSEGRVGLVDFGAVGHLAPDLKGQLATTLVALDRGDLDLIISAYMDIGVFSDSADLASIRMDLADLLDRYYGAPASQIDLSAVFADMIHLARRHDIQLPRDFVMLGRAFMLASGLIRQLDPQINMAEAIAPYARRLALERLSPRRLLTRAGTTAYNIAGLLSALPRDLRILMRKIQAGRLTLTFRHEGLENLTRELDRSSSRIAFAVIIAAVIVGSSLIMVSKLRPHIYEDVSFLGIVGYLFAGFLGLGLAWSIYRSGKL